MEAQPPSIGAYLLERFAQKNPLAASLRLVFERLFEPAALNALFEAHRDQQYTRKVLFATIVEVMLAVVTRKVDSVHAALQARGDALGASFTAVYNKLNRSDAGPSEALVRRAYDQGRALLVEMGGLRAEPLAGWRLRVVDGNHLAATERRLQALWGVAAGPLPGLALAVFDVAAQMVSELVLCEDGHAQERSLTDRLLALVKEGECWVADRNFCTQAILSGLITRGAALVIRQHANLPFELAGPRVAKGRCETGELFEQAVTITVDGKTHALRRVTVVLDTPTRDQDAELHILTTLPPTVSAETVARLYAGRWTIESAFSDLARWLQSEIAPLGYPRAALLGFSVSVMAYNAMTTLLGALRATHGEAVVQEQVSGYYIAQYGRDAVGAIDDLVEPEDWRPWQSMPLYQAAALLKAIAARIDLRRLLKHPRKTKTPVPPRTRFKGEPHVSTKKLLDEAKGRPAKKGSSKTR